MTALTDTAPPTPATQQKKRSVFVDWLIDARTRPTVRADLRRADQAALADRAYPHLARFWTNKPYLREPVLLTAAAAAQYDRIRDLPDTPHSLGVAARALTHNPNAGQSEDMLGQRLIALQRQSLPNAHRMLHGLYHGLNDTRAGLNWDTLWRTYRNWEHPDPEIRRRIRRRVLEDFYGAFAADPTDT